MSQRNDEAKTGRVFRNVYYNVYKCRPYTDMSYHTELQESNGLNLGYVLHSRKSCADIGHHIGNQM